MAKYRITAPDGATYEVSGNGTEQEALAAFQQQWTAQQEPQKPYKLKLDNVDGATAYSWSGKGGQAGGVEQVLGGAQHAWDRAAYGLEGAVRYGASKVLPEGWVNPDIAPEHQKQLQQGRAFVKETGPASSIGEVAADIGLAFVPTTRALQGATALSRVLPRALGTATRVAAPSATGAAVGALTQPEDPSTGALAGALGGATGQAIQRVGRGLVRPLVNPEAQALMQQGVQPTVGQSVRGSWAGNAINTAEEQMRSWPLVGASVDTARHRAVTEANQRMANRVGQEVGMTPGAIGEAGDSALTNLRAGIGNEYDRVLDTVKSVPIAVRDLQQTLKTVANDPSLGLSDDSIKRLTKYVEANMLSRGTPTGVDKAGNVIHEVTGEAAKQIESDIGKAANRFANSAVGEERAYGEALQRMHEAWRSMLELKLPSHVEIENLRAANRAWAGFSPLDKAAGYVGSQNAGGVATPATLKRAVAALDKSQNDNRTRAARNVLPNATQNPREYVEAMSNAMQTLGNRVPDSGTAGRLLLPGALMTGAGLGGGLLGMGGAAVALPVAYSEIGQRLLTQGVAPRAAERFLQWAARKGIQPEMLEANFQNLLRVMAQQGVSDATQ